MRARWAVTLLATVGVLAIATLFYTRSDLPKEERPGINPSSHGVGVLFGSPKYKVKWELVEGGLLDKQQHRKPPEEQVISEPAHGFGVLFGKPDPNYTPPGTPVDSPDLKLTLPEKRWEKMTLNRYGDVVPNEGRPSAAVGVDK